MRVMQSFAWQPIDQTPTAPGMTTAVMAYQDSESGWVLDSEVYMWDGHAWAGEISGCQPRPGMYWADEQMLLDNLNHLQPCMPPAPEAA